ncbi:MAG: 30S ribosomal protein S17e [Candidatus Heimdallarchaeota archaeon]|nr:30S ribosomal protein S17e [Candidatus Heimdallarchaeota archaeon]
MWSRYFIGNVRSRAIKRISKNIVISFYDQCSIDFESNKHLVASVTNVQSKSYRNKVAGYVTTLMKQIKDNKIQTLEELI